jgi:hypothetical protein
MLEYMIHRAVAAWVLIALCPCPAFAQRAGTFSASEAAGIAGRSAAREQAKPPILTADTIDTWLPQQVAELQARLRAARKGVINPKAARASVNWDSQNRRYQFRTKRDRDEEVKRLEAEVKSPTLPPLHVFALKTGQIGSIVDPREPSGISYSGDGLVTGFDFTISQITNANSAVIDVDGGRRSTRFILVSPLVADLQEGQVMKALPGAFIVQPRRRYATVLGAVSTLPVLASYDLRPHLAKIPKKLKP